MQPISIETRIPWHSPAHLQDQIARSGCAAVTIVGSDTGPIHVGWSRNPRKYIWQRKSDHHQPTTIYAIRWVYGVGATLLCDDIRDALARHQIGSNWFSVLPVQALQAMKASAARRDITTAGHIDFLAAVERQEAADSKQIAEHWGEEPFDDAEREEWIMLLLEARDRMENKSTQQRNL